jgi:hypothetical protein
MTAPNPPAVRRTFRQRVEWIARASLKDAVPAQRLAEAVASVALSFASAHRLARDPSALEDCTDESIGNCVALSALTGLYPGGPAPLVYLVPKSPRKGAPKELGWWLSHRGICALALDDGFVLVSVPVHVDDQYRIEFGEVVSHESLAEPKRPEDLAGVYLTIRRAADGVVLSRPWLSAEKIGVRAAKAITDDVWKVYPIEMAQKTAIHWAHSRGFLPLRSAKALEAMAEMVPEVESTPVATVRPVVRKAIGEDFTPEETGAKAPETVNVNATPNEDESP